MNRTDKTIAVIGTAHIIQYGISSLIREHLGGYRISAYKEPGMLQNIPESQYPDIILIDAGIIESNIKIINTLKKEFPHTPWIGYQYQFVSPSVMQVCDDFISIDQTVDEIIVLLNKAFTIEKELGDDLKSGYLSDRETDVLRLLVTGYSSKEIADRLNISINTVISHRKNISQKTGIKSLAGLTIYAVTKKVISMSSLQKL